MVLSPEPTDDEQTSQGLEHAVDDGFGVGAPFGHTTRDGGT